MAEDFVGTKRWICQATPYEIYMDEQKLPIHRGTIGFYDIRDLTLAPWPRMGARGAFLELNGCGNLQGIYAIEIPAAGAIAAEKHMYEEYFTCSKGAARRKSGAARTRIKSKPSNGRPGVSFRRRSTRGIASSTP